MTSILNQKNTQPPAVLSKQNQVIAVEFPLHGVWITPNTPGTTVPSHGTTKYGESYAIDFVMVNDDDPLKKAYKKSFFTYLLFGLNLSDFYGWGQTVYAPIDGEVVSVVTSIEERNPVKISDDIRNMITVTNKYAKDENSPALVAGNHILIQSSTDLYLLLAHMKKGSIIVKPGQKIHVGQPLGQLGHSGNSTMPHLHMQFMDSQNFKIAEGVPFVFRKYEVKKNNEWKTVYNSLPTTTDTIRYVPD